MYQPIKLPYSFSDLEPYIDTETMQVHFNNHYLGYIEKLNKAVSKRSIFVPVKNLIQNVSSTAIRNNGGGYYNHSLYFLMLTPPGSIKTFSSKNYPKLNFFIERDFGSYENFQKEILLKSQERFGSGWVWWVQYPNGKTEIITTANQDNPVMFDKKLTILLGVDVWEHAYYLKHKSFRDNYVKDIFNVINWNFVESRLS
jgi:Fe-Mn family superoxide dismutase